MPDVRKNNIVLSDYNHQRDIENRSLMADLSVFEVDVLREILHSSLKFSRAQLAESLNVSEKAIVPVLKKLTKTKLVTYNEETVIVDKDMRKYYESQILKFDDNFEPDMEFFQGLLSKVPIHALPSWYAIPCSSDRIFTAIVENYLLTPKIYERYLNGLRLNNDAMEGIMQDVFQAPELKVSGKALMKKYRLSRESFEEHMLHLEYNIVCCLGYSKEGDAWEEMVTPFHEWKCYLQFERENHPKPISNPTAIRKESVIIPDDETHSAYRKIMTRFRNNLEDSSDFTEKDIREVERSLKRVVKTGWIYFDEFMNGFTAPIGTVNAVMLQNKGKRWKYALPTYTDAERNFIKKVIFEGLAQAGIVDIGTHQNRACFCVTKTGRQLVDG